MGVGLQVRGLLLDSVLLIRLKNFLPYKCHPSDEKVKEVPLLETPSFLERLTVCHIKWSVWCCLKALCTWLQCHNRHETATRRPFFVSPPQFLKGN